jgi:hypothetical protein
MRLDTYDTEMREHLIIWNGESIFFSKSEISSTMHLIEEICCHGIYRFQGMQDQAHTGD